MADKKKSEKKKQVEEITVLLKQVQADFENYKKRVEKEQKDFAVFASSGIIKELLPVLDSFDLALKHDNEEVKVIYDQLWQILSVQGLSKIGALGKKFDPTLHEALMQEESDKEKEIVIEELQAGYLFKDNVIRHTKVKVSK